MIKKHHPADRAERLALKRKYSLKTTRRKGLSDEYLGTIHETTTIPASQEGSRDETDQPRTH